MSKWRRTQPTLARWQASTPGCPRCGGLSAYPQAVRVRRGGIARAQMSHGWWGSRRRQPNTPSVRVDGTWVPGRDYKGRYVSCPDPYHTQQRWDPEREDTIIAERAAQAARDARLNQRDPDGADARRKQKAQRQKALHGKDKR